MTKTQAKRLLKLANFLEHKVGNKTGKDGQKKFDMTTWFSRPTGCKAKRPGLTEASCGTTACALGWATAVWPGQLRIVNLERDWAGDSEQGNVEMMGLPGYGVVEIGENFFGLSETHFFYLFGGDRRRSAKQEARVIRTFVKRQGVL